MGWFTKKQPPIDAALRAEYRTLAPDQKRMVDAVIAQVRQTGKSVRTDYNGSDFYGYPHGSGGVAWGIDGGQFGFNIKRGVEP